ncbi:MAG: SRPBCC family protein [Solirubrobacteraceae bacterium]
MSTVSARIEIGAPIERVWATVMDPMRLGDWVTIHKSVREVSDTPLRAGSTMEQALHVLGLTFKVHWTLTTLLHPRLAEWQGGGPAHSNAIIRYELSSVSPDVTLFHYTNEFHPPGGRVGSLASRMIVGATSEREATHSLTRLKALLERI